MAVLSEPMTADPSQHRPELTERLDTLRRNESFCDVTVAVKGTEFKAHKVVLAAASPFFLSLLESNMRESNEQVIRIELEEATAPVMEDVLKYIYTGNISVAEESGHNLIVTADYLLLPGLKTVAYNFLKENVTIENCVFNYYFADKYQCMELKDECCEVINSNFSVVMETDDFLKLDVKQLMEWVSSDDITVSAEEEVFKGIVKWVNYNKSERENDFPDLLHQVRLISISHDFLFHELVKEKLVTTHNDSINFVLGSMESIFSSSCESAKLPRKCLEKHTEGIFLCGGRKALCYLPQQNKWYQLANMILEHNNHTVMQCRDKVYIFDAQQIGPGKSRVIEYYLCSSNSFGTIQRHSYRDVCFSSLSVHNGEMYATDNDHFWGPKIVSYNPDKNDWNSVNEPHKAQWGTCIISDGQNHLYIVGGSPSFFINEGSTKVKRFDPSGGSWEEVAAMNEARHDPFGAAMNGKISGCSWWNAKEWANFYSDQIMRGVRPINQ